MKICSKCGLNKPLCDFGKDRYRSDQLTTQCRVCKRAATRQYAEANPEKVSQNRRKYYLANSAAINAAKRGNARQRQWRLRHKYRLTVEQFNALLLEQNNRCKICLREFTETPCVDHDRSCCSSDRSCGACIRGLLCRRCNKGLGAFGDDVATLKSAISYLEDR